jgi:hypothetical protein
MDDKVVVRYIDGKMIKGYISDFSETSDSISVREIDNEKLIQVPVDSLKAIFFVKSFEGKRSYNEKKVYGISAKKGERAFVKFKDAESLVGFLYGDVPWDKKKGFFLSKINTELKGFYIYPVDRGSNNIKIFVMLSAVQDVSIMS